MRRLYRQPIRASGADGNTSEIVGGLRTLGASVVVLTSVGGGVADLLVGWGGVNHLLEVKPKPKRGEVAPSRARLRPSQEKFRDSWRGLKPVVVLDLPEAVRAIGMRVIR